MKGRSSEMRNEKPLQWPWEAGVGVRADPERRRSGFRQMEVEDWRKEAGLRG